MSDETKKPTTEQDEPDQYEALWTALKPSILEKMTALTIFLKESEDMSHVVSEPYVSGPDEEFGSDTYRVTVDLKNEADITVLAAEFELVDGADEGEEGFAVVCNLSGYNALVLGGYAPDAYTEDFFTLDQDTLVSRIEEFDPYEMAAFIKNDALQNETLLREVAEASSGMSQS